MTIPTRVQSGSGARGWRTWAGVVLAGFALLAAGCNAERNLIDERNPFYLKGMRLRQENKFDEAAVAFEKCLRLTPNSVKAHLQLAMLYEDRLNDPVQAIYHYRMYLQMAPKSENADTVQKWLARVERVQFQQLAERYPEDVEALIARNQSASGSGTLTPRERFLVQRLKQANTEVIRLRQELAKLEAERAAGSAPGREPAMPAPAAPAGAVKDSPPAAAPAAPEAAVAMQEPPMTNDGPVAEPVDEPAAARTAVPPSAAAAPTGAATVAAPPSAAVPAAPATPVVVASMRSPAAAPASPAAASATSAAPPPAGRNFVAIRNLSTGRVYSGSAVPSGAGAAPPAAAAASVPASAPAAAYTVQAGDTLSSIARKVYGSPKQWTLLRDANSALLHGGTQVKPGMRLAVPPNPAAVR